MEKKETVRTGQSLRQEDSEIKIRLPDPFDKQKSVILSRAKRKIIRAGRRGGKTKLVALIAGLAFLAGRRVLYAAPVAEQIEAFWTTIVRAFFGGIEARIYYKNETEHVIELPMALHVDSEARIRAKTAWNADTLRGDYADLLILDEWQLMNEDAWEHVGVPMLLDNNGDAIFLYTPPSLHSRSVSKANDPQHAAKMFEKYRNDRNGRWETFHWTSHDNPYVSGEALEDITKDMTSLAYRMEILAEDINEAPGALWKRGDIDANRIAQAPDLVRIVVGVDPSVTRKGNEAGIIGAGLAGNNHGYVLADRSIQGSPLEWAQEAVRLYHELQADCVVAEANQGGEMVELTIAQADPNVPVKLVYASRGKQTRAEPISAKYERGFVHHVGKFEKLEDELCLWIPGDASPNRLDAAVWALTDLMLSVEPGLFIVRRETEEPHGISAVREETRRTTRGIDPWFLGE
jgi:hypothetical protein